MFDGRRAAGVVYKRGGKERTMKAKKEVILCAGTVGSAKLLLLSGVGPRNHLLKMKVGSTNHRSGSLSRLLLSLTHPHVNMLKIIVGIWRGCASE